MDTIHISSGYAGFWQRVLAAIIDGILLNIVITIISIPLGIGSVLSVLPMLMSNQQDPTAMAGLLSSLFAGFFLMGTVSMVVQWLYSALMESSQLQATVGKLALSIVVVDLNGQRISFARATGRYFSKYLSTLILCIGFLMVAFTERKQGLHDIIAGTLVVKKG